LSAAWRAFGGNAAFDIVLANAGGLIGRTPDLADRVRETGELSPDKLKHVPQNGQTPAF
jgi:hypothetical protein